MDITVQRSEVKEWQADVLLCPLPEKKNIVLENDILAQAVPWLLHSPAIRDVLSDRGEISLLYGESEAALSRTLFFGLGNPDELSLDDFRLSLAKALKFCDTHKFSSVILPQTLLDSLPFGKTRLLEESVYAACLSRFHGKFLQTKENAPFHAHLTIALTPSQNLETVQKAVDHGKKAGEATNFARSLVDLPANLLTPDDLAKKALEIANANGFSCTILDENALRENHMGAFLAVGQGSVHPPRLVVLEYAHENAPTKEPVVLIGKGICFDSGGISLKPAAKMHLMKGDMTGAAAVLSALQAIAQEKLPCHVVGLLACAENMPDGGAVKPGDVVSGMNGETIEITNTDAEGRLVLCDALVYAQKHWEPKAIIDIATLTGACAIALGDELAGLFCTTDTLASRIEASGKVAGEYFWRMPLWKNYTKKLESDIADICHTGVREGGAINAALFLKHFVSDAIPWAHLDVAGVDYNEKKSALCPKGATGFGARTLFELVRGGLE